MKGGNKIQPINGSPLKNEYYYYGHLKAEHTHTYSDCLKIQINIHKNSYSLQVSFRRLTFRGGG